MLREYLDNAMSKAVYERLEDGSYCGKIPACPGVIAFGITPYECQNELYSVLEGWIIVKLRHNDQLPVMNGIELNPKMKEVMYA